MNLISNSLKFTEHNGYITVNISESSGDDGKLCLNIKISDTGHGMAPEFIKKMYLPFEQEMADEKTSGEGSGLGLTIVKKYIEMMNGTIRVDSVPEKGTTFYLSIPVEVSEESVQELLDRSGSLQEDLFTGKRILLVDDNSINLNITEKLLRSKNFEVDTAENAKAAVDKYFSSSLLKLLGINGSFTYLDKYTFLYHLVCDVSYSSSCDLKSACYVYSRNRT